MSGSQTVAYFGPSGCFRALLEGHMVILAIAFLLTTWVVCYGTKSRIQWEGVHRNGGGGILMFIPIIQFSVIVLDMLHLFKM